MTERDQAIGVVANAIGWSMFSDGSEEIIEITDEQLALVRSAAERAVDQLAEWQARKVA